MKQCDTEITENEIKINFNKECAPVSCSVEKLAQAIKCGDAQGVTKAVDDIVCTSQSKENNEKAIDLLENEFFRKNNYYLAKFLFLLYDNIGIEYMARFYLQYCYEEIISRSDYVELVKKYLVMSPGVIKENYSAYNGDFAYEYEGQKKMYGVHSFSNDIGQNLTLLITPYGSLILDCGAKSKGNTQMSIDKNELLTFLKVYNVSVEDIVGVLISHAHLDHYGSMSTLLEIGIPLVKFYTDSKTKDIIRVVAANHAIEGARPVTSFFVANRKIKVHSYNNGHILGSQLFVIRFDDKTIVYTGDFCLHNQQVVQGLNVSRLLEDEFVLSGVDCLIIESTYGNKIPEILPYCQAEKALVRLIDKLLCKDYKIFLPAFALGRSQELTSLLKEKHKLLLDGMSVKLTQAYEDILGEVIASSNVKYSTNDDSRIENFDFNDIIIAGAGMISENSMAVKYIEELFKSKHPVAIIRTGHGDGSEESYGYGIFQGWKKRGGLLLDVSLSAHAEYRELFTLIDSLTPKNIVAVHGPGIIHKLPFEKNQGLFLGDDCGGDFNETYNGENLQKSIRIADVGVQSRWKNTVKTGMDCIQSGKALSDSVAFHNAFKLLIKSINTQSYEQVLLKKMEDLDTIEQLFDFLKNTVDNGFVV